MKTSVSLFTVTFVGFLAVSRCQVGFPGGCPKVATITDFKLDDYTGLWHEYSNYFTLYEEGQRCINTTYRSTGGGLFSVLSQSTNALNQLKSVFGEATPVNAGANDGKYTVRFPVNLVGNLLTSFKNGNYWVLDTDYTTYSIVWDCTNFFVYNTQKLWILTRERSPADSVVTKVTNKLERLNLDTTSLIKTNNENCG